MASLVTNATRIAAAKESIKQSIRNKGIEVSDDLKIEDYSSKIDLIKQGIEEGTYNIEVYVRIDNVLIGEGVEFEVVGTDGTKTAATSRAGGYVFLTLNYGVGYDMQPKDQAAYYAESHPLIYHLKDEGNYFATDYYFTTAQSGGGDDFYITKCNYLFYRNGTVNGGLWTDFDNVIKRIKSPTSARYFYTQEGNGSSYWKVPLSRMQQMADLDFSQCVAINNFWSAWGINNEESGKTLTVNMDLSKCTTMNAAFKKINYGYTTGTMLNIEFNFNGTTGIVTDFKDCFSYLAPNQTTYILQNINMDSATDVTYMFNGTVYGNSITKFTFKGSFGGLSTTSSLTLDMSTCNLLTLEALTEMLTTISPNTNGKTRIFKLSSTIYESLTEDILLLAAEKGYDLSA